MTAKKKRSGKKRPAARKDARGFTEQQLTFCVNYVANGGNGSQAAIDAGYGAAGAKVRAHRLLELPRIREKIAELTARAADQASATIEQAGVTAVAEQAITAEAERSKIDVAVETLKQRVRSRLESIGLTELPEIVSWTDDQVKFIPSDQLAAAARGSVKSVKSKQDEVITDEGDKILRRTTMEVQQHNPMPALRELMDLLQMKPQADPRPGTQPLAVGVQVIVSGGPTGIETGAIQAANNSGNIPTPPDNIAPAPENIAEIPTPPANPHAPRPWNPGKRVRGAGPTSLSAIAERARAALATAPSHQE